MLLNALGADAARSVAVEDSNPGIASARAAGLFTIGYRQHLPEGYMQTGPNATAESMKDVQAILSRGTISP